MLSGTGLDGRELRGDTPQGRQPVTQHQPLGEQQGNRRSREPAPEAAPKAHPLSAEDIP